MIKHIKIITIVYLTALVASCNKAVQDQLIIENGSISSFKNLEKELESKSLTSNSNMALPWKYLPVDSHFVMTNPVKFQRSSYASIPMSCRAYSDSLNNQILIYEWDLVTPDLSEKEKDALKRDFENQHKIYVTKYNELIDRVTYVFGAPEYADKDLQSNNLEVYQNYFSKNVWRKNNQVIEVSIFLLPNEIYRVTLKNFIFSK